jgi:hypothetical protein
MQLYATLHGPLMRLPALPGQLRAAFPPQPGGRPWAHDITTLAAVEKKAGVVVLVFTVDPAFAHFCYVGLRLPPSRRGAVYGVTELQQLLGGMAAVFQNQPMVYEQWEGGAESALPEHAAPRNVLFYRPLTAESDLYSVATASAGRLLRDEPAALQAAYTALEDVWAAMADESPASQAEEDASVGLPSLAMTGDSAFAPAQPTAPARKPNLLHVTYSDKPTARLAMETSGSGGVTNPLVGTLLDGTSPVEPLDGGRVHLDAGSAVPQPVDAAGRHVYHSFYLASNVTNLNTARPVQYFVAVPPGNPLDAAPRAALVRAVAEATNTAAWGKDRSAVAAGAAAAMGAVSSSARSVHVYRRSPSIVLRPASFCVAPPAGYTNYPGPSRVPAVVKHAQNAAEKLAAMSAGWTDEQWVNFNDPESVWARGVPL